MQVVRESVLDALSRVIDPELRKPVTELDMVRDVAIDGGAVTVTIARTVAACPLRNSFQEQVAREVGAVDGVASVRLDFDVMTPEARSALTTKLRGGRRRAGQVLAAVDPGRRVLASRPARRCARRRRVRPLDPAPARDPAEAGARRP